MRQRPAFAILVLFCCACFSGCNRATENGGEVVTPPVVEAAEGVNSETATLEIDFKERDNLVLTVPCETDSTVYLLLESARDRGDLKFESTGKGEMAFVKSIAGIKNQAASGDNWVYRVNGELGDRSCGVFSVKPGDHVLWVFGVYP